MTYYDLEVLYWLVGWGICVLMHDYRQLRVYDMAIEITSETYRLTRMFPRSERYGLVQQMNRASVSIASNIAEGAGRGDSRDFARFLRIARGSGCELEAQVTMAARVGSVDGEAAVSPLIRGRTTSYVLRTTGLPPAGSWSTPLISEVPL